MSGALRFGIVGLDHWYSAVPLAEQLAGHADAELVVVADRDLRRAEEVAGRTRARATADIDAVLADPRIDAIASFVSPDLNPAVCVRAAEAGKRILSVKPFAMTLDDADRIVAAVERTGVPFVPAETRARAAEPNLTLARAVRSGELGRVVSASFVLSGGLPESWPGSGEPGWWTDPARTPGGAWLDHAIYQIDALRWLLGAEVVSVEGRIARLRDPGLAVEDYGHAVVLFDDGVVAAVEDTWTAAPGAARTTSTLNGTAGAIEVDTMHGQCSTNAAGASGWRHAPLPEDAGDPLAPILERFRGGAGPLGTVHDARRNLAACLAFYAAATVTPSPGR